MTKPKPLTNPAGDVRELTVEDMSAIQPMSVLSATLKRKIGERKPQKEPTKERITIRLSRDVVARFRATGEGWQTRVDAALQDWLKRHKSVA